MVGLNRKNGAMATATTAAAARQRYRQRNGGNGMFTMNDGATCCGCIDDDADDANGNSILVVLT